MISAFLDTNVLLGITETDPLLSLSETGGMSRPYWSEYVFDELKEHLPERLEESGSEDAFRKACRRIDAMRYAFPESMVPASKWELYSSIAEKYVNDLDDTQILAGAIACDMARLPDCPEEVVVNDTRLRQCPPSLERRWALSLYRKPSYEERRTGLERIGLRRQPHHGRFVWRIPSH